MVLETDLGLELFPLSDPERPLAVLQPLAEAGLALYSDEGLVHVIHAFGSGKHLSGYSVDRATGEVVKQIAVPKPPRTPFVTNNFEALDMDPHTKRFLIETRQDPPLTSFESFYLYDMKTGSYKKLGPRRNAQGYFLTSSLAGLMDHKE